jgi:DNA-binding SARP family transcriptional activator
MYLVTRPSFTANREQIFDELWPDNDPASASNSLNQSLFFLRRELDPWFEDDLSVDYVAVQGELVWLNSRLVQANSADFLTAAHLALKGGVEFPVTGDVLMSYKGQFAPEFEYDEWAMAWRIRLHTTFLELSTRAVTRATEVGELVLARDFAVHSLAIDPDNPEMEWALIWLLWHSGARAAATAQYQHLAATQRADGVDPTSLEAIVSCPKPT